MHLVRQLELFEVVAAHARSGLVIFDIVLTIQLYDSVDLSGIRMADSWELNACDGKYGMCQYAGVCSVSPRLREKVLETEFELNPWNPLEAADETEAVE